MGLDVRLPIGLLFALVGGLLAGYGAFGPRTDGPNINLWWGLVLLAFAALMLWLSWRSRGRARVP